MVKVLNGIPGEEKKKHWKIPADGESFEWNSRVVQFLKIDILNIE